MGAEFFHADRRTDLTKLIVAFHSFANPLKNCSSRERNRESVSPALITPPSTNKQYVNVFDFSAITSDVTKLAWNAPYLVLVAEQINFISAASHT